MNKYLKYRQQNSRQNYNLNLANKSLEKVDKKDNWKRWENQNVSLKALRAYSFRRKLTVIQFRIL